MLLALASAVFLRSESLGTRDHILLSQIRDFIFVASYDSQDHGGSIRPRLHTGIPLAKLLRPAAHSSRYIAAARSAQKTVSPLLWFVVFTERLPGNVRGTDSIENGRSDCCLATINNIRNSSIA
jgi:hypothetical protein